MGGGVQRRAATVDFVRLQLSHDAIEPAAAAASGNRSIIAAVDELVEWGRARRDETVRRLPKDDVGSI